MVHEKNDPIIYNPTGVEPRRTPWLWAALGLILFLAVTLLLWRPGLSNFTPEVTGAPKVKVDRALDDAGYVKYGTPLESVFKLRNVGDRSLEILGEPQVELVEGCCPPYAAVGATTLAPGEETTLTMNYSMYEGMGGPHEFHIRLQTNDPAEPELVLVAKSDWGP